MKYILFWSTTKEGETIEEFTSRGMELSEFHSLALASHVKLGNDTTIYTYQNLEKSKVPKGIKLKDASEFYSVEEAFYALSIGHSIAHVSDIVRISASIKYSGVVLDMDVVMLRKMEEVETFYSSMPAKRTGGVAPQWGKAHPPITIHDGSWDGKALAAFPLKIGEPTKDSFQKLVDKIKDSLSKTPKKSSKAWNYVIWTVKDIIKEDTQGKVFKPFYNVPVASWMGAGKCYSIEKKSRLDGETKVFGHLMPSKKSILEGSNMVSHFFESAFSKSSGVASTFWDDLEDGCLLADEAEFVMGYHWRKNLNNYKNSFR
jgi:hypothetical protein